MRSATMTFGVFDTASAKVAPTVRFRLGVSEIRVEKSKLADTDVR